MITGTVKKIAEGKGFGFIRADDAEGTEYFFHQSGCHPKGSFDALTEGTKVEFTAGEAKPGKGPRAERVVRIK